MSCVSLTCRIISLVLFMMWSEFFAFLLVKCVHPERSRVISRVLKVNVLVKQQTRLIERDCSGCTS